MFHSFDISYVMFTHFIFASRKYIHQHQSFFTTVYLRVYKVHGNAIYVTCWTTNTNGTGSLRNFHCVSSQFQTRRDSNDVSRQYERYLGCQS